MKDALMTWHRFQYPRRVGTPAPGDAGHCITLLGTSQRGFALTAHAIAYSPSRYLLDAGDLKFGIQFEGISKIGHRLIARRLEIGEIRDRQFHLLPSQEVTSLLNDTRIREQLDGWMRG